MRASMCEGLTGHRYLKEEKRATEHLFSTFNSLPRTNSTSKGVPYLERLIVTHPDEDHMQGIDSLVVMEYLTNQTILSANVSF